MTISAKCVSPVDRVFDALDLGIEYCDAAVQRIEQSVPRLIWLVFRVIVVWKLIKWLLIMISQ